jgi:hypothetical protein
VICHRGHVEEREGCTWAIVEFSVGLALGSVQNEQCYFSFIQKLFKWIESIQLKDGLLLLENFQIKY